MVFTRKIGKSRKDGDFHGRTVSFREGNRDVHQLLPQTQVFQSDDGRSAMGGVWRGKDSLTMEKKK